MAIKKRFLTRALLASSLFATSLYANTFIPPPPVVFPVITNGTSDNTLEILVNGQVNATGKVQDAIVVNSGVAPNVTNGGNVLIDAGNNNGVKAVVADTNKIGVNFQGFGVLRNGTLTIGAGSGIDASFAGSDAIVVNNTGVSITNAGTIQASQSALYLTSNALGTLLNNTLGGVIQNVPGGLDHTIFTQGGAVGPTLSLTNAGIISQSSAGFDTLQMNSPFTSIMNNSGGIIQNTGITLTNNAINIVNSSSNGTITNKQGGLISAAGSGAAIIVGGDLGTINNAGTLQTLGTGSAIIFNKLAANNTVGGIINSGDIIANNPTLGVIVNANNGTTITNNLVNSGNIIGLTSGNKAIDFQTKITHAAVIQNGGVINGNVYLAQDDATLGSKVFTLNDGIIAGNVIGAFVTGKGNTFAVNAGTISGALTGNGKASNTFNLAGGEITGPVTLGDFNDTVNLDGTNAAAIIGGIGNDTFNITGGSFTSLNGGGGGNKLNVNKTFTANGSIDNVQFIKINNPQTVFTANAPITHVDMLFTINPQTTLIPNNLISGMGDIVNDGQMKVQGAPVIDLSSGNGKLVNNELIALASTGVLTIQGNPTTPVVFSNNPTAVITTQIAGLQVPGDTVQNGQIIVNSALPGSVVLAADSIIQPTFTGFLPQGNIVNVVSEIGGGTILDNASLHQPNSAVISFEKIDNPLLNTKQVQLQTIRKSYQSLSDSGITQGIAHMLDGLAFGNGPNDADFLDLLGQLDALPSGPAVESAMKSLLPPFNYGLIAGSYLGMTNTFESIQLRIEDLYARRMMWSSEPSSTGLSFGDPAGSYSVWGKLLGAYLNQRDRDTIEGYRAKGVGVAFGADWGVNNCTTFGLAGSFTRVNVDDKENSAKDENIKSWQGTAYGWWEFIDGLYLDAMVGFASNRYQLHRNIHVNEIDTLSQADFKGKQYGVQGDIGWSYANDDIYYFVPFARVKYIHLNLDDYQETGAGSLSLAVHNENVSELLAGFGFRTGVSYEKGDICYVPEMTMLLSYDFENKGEQTLASFIGGTAFPTNGIKPGRAVLEMAFGMNMHITPDSIFSVKYNLAFRKQFAGNALYFQYNYLWE